VPARRVARGSRWLVMSDVKAALDGATDGQCVLVVARGPLIKRGGGRDRAAGA
jgi:hypothetical protein